MPVFRQGKAKDTYEEGSVISLAYQNSGSTQLVQLCFSLYVFSTHVRA